MVGPLALSNACWHCLNNEIGDFEAVGVEAELTVESDFEVFSEVLIW